MGVFPIPEHDVELRIIGRDYTQNWHLRFVERGQGRDIDVAQQGSFPAGLHKRIFKAEYITLLKLPPVRASPQLALLPGPRADGE